MITLQLRFYTHFYSTPHLQSLKMFKMIFRGRESDIGFRADLLEEALVDKVLEFDIMS